MCRRATYESMGVHWHDHFLLTLCIVVSDVLKERVRICDVSLSCNIALTMLTAARGVFDGSYGVIAFCNMQISEGDVLAMLVRMNSYLWNA